MGQFGYHGLQSTVICSRWWRLEETTSAVANSCHHLYTMLFAKDARHTWPDGLVISSHLPHAFPVHQGGVRRQLNKPANLQQLQLWRLAIAATAAAGGWRHCCHYAVRHGLELVLLQQLPVLVVAGACTKKVQRQVCAGGGGGGAGASVLTCPTS